MLAVYITLGLIFVITLLVLFLCFPQKSKKANELKEDLQKDYDFEMIG